MKRVYLVRHGQTVCNVNQTIQSPDDELTDTGKMQAIKLAERVENIKFEKIICSDYKRTRQTAEPIVDSSNVPIEYSELFREERPPSGWRDRPENSKEGTQFFNNMVEKAGDPFWRVEDAENASDVFERIKKALKLLEEDPAENILVVSHGTFLKQLIAYIMLDCKADVSDVVAFKATLKTVNTGISMILHDGTRWRVLSWNDHAHFAE